MDMIRQQMSFYDPTFLLSRELMQDPAHARSDLPIHRFTTIFGDKDPVSLAFPARVRQALPARFCHTVLLRICQQAIRGELYSRNAQSCSSLTSGTSGLPPLSIYTTLTELQTDLDEWLRYYNEERVHQGRWCYGRTPMQTFIETIPLAKEKLLAA
jgi:hypothetical protein